MCGLLFSTNNNQDDFADALRLISHRGPDAFNLLAKDGYNFGHVRLSIIGLDDRASQPITSPDGRFILLFNGEIYNYKELHDQNKLAALFDPLPISDTRELLFHIANFGLRSTRSKCNGMFGFLLYDALEKTVSISRDDGGEKPIYYYLTDNEVIVSSELRCIKHLARKQLHINPVSVKAYLCTGYIPAPLTIFSNAKKLRPGETLKIDLKGNQVCQEEIVRRNYCEVDIAKDFDYADFKKGLFSAVESRIVADVPVAAMLSGGIDSSIVAAVYQRITDRKIHTFNMSFDDETYDEGNSADAIARRIGSKHTRLNFDKFDLLDNVERLATVYDEPFGDPSQLPTYMICQKISNEFKVCLSGDGGDEAMLGYNRHIAAYYLSLFQQFPPFAQRIIKEIFFGRLNGWAWTNPFLQNRNSKISSLQRKLNKLKLVFENNEIWDFYTKATLVHENNSVACAIPFDVIFDKNKCDQIEKLNLVDATAALDSSVYLPDCIFFKVDRASMYNSLEVRAPFLDKRFLAKSRSISYKLKVAKGIGKQPLRMVADDLIGNDLFSSKKKGFGFPTGSLFRGLLNQYIRETYETSWLIRNGYVDAYYYNSLIQRIENFDTTADLPLWNLFAFDNWALKNKI